MNFNYEFDNVLLPPEAPISRWTSDLGRGSGAAKRQRVAVRTMEQQLVTGLERIQDHVPRRKPAGIIAACDHSSGGSRAGPLYTGGQGQGETDDQRQQPSGTFVAPDRPNEGGSVGGSRRSIGGRSDFNSERTPSDRGHDSRAPSLRTASPDDNSFDEMFSSSQQDREPADSPTNYQPITRLHPDDYMATSTGPPTPVADEPLLDTPDGGFEQLNAAGSMPLTSPRALQTFTDAIRAIVATSVEPEHQEDTYLLIMESLLEAAGERIPSPGDSPADPTTRSHTTPTQQRHAAPLSYLSPEGRQRLAQAAIRLFGRETFEQNMGQ